MSDEAIETLASRLAAAQCELRNPPMYGRNPHFGSKFATLASCIKAVRPVLARHGLAIVQCPGTVDGGVSVTTSILFGSERLESTVSCRCGVKPQDMGSAITYLRRYALCAMAGVVGDDDDDARAAQGDPKAQQAAAWAVAQELGATDASSANELTQRASDGALSWGDCRDQPGEVLAVLRDLRDNGAPVGLGGDT